MKIDCHCLLQGEDFSPSTVEKQTSLVFHKKNEPSEKGSIGRYRNRPIPYGSAELKFEADSITPDMLSPKSHSLTVLRKNIKLFRDAGATMIVLHFDVAYEGQCNIEISPDLLSKLAELGIPVTISCFEDNQSVGWVSEA